MKNFLVFLLVVNFLITSLRIGLDVVVRALILYIFIDIVPLAT
jgi:hypothetical protein